MDSLNIIIMGKTGAGKSTLLNAVFNENLAPTGCGQAVTRENKVYSRNVLLPLGEINALGQYGMVWKKLNLYDTVGLEIDSNLTKKTLGNIQQIIIKAKENEFEKDLTLVWFCVNCRSSRFEKYELELIKKLSIDYEIPFVIVMTQCYSDERGELEKQILSDLPEITLIRILAKEYHMRGGAVIPVFGVDDLLRKSILNYNQNKVRLLEIKLNRLMQDKENIVIELRKKGQNCVDLYAKRALKIGFVPVGCIPIIHGMCIKMLADLNKLVGINSFKGFATDIFADAVVGAIATPFMGVPLLSAVITTTYVQAVGELYLECLMGVIERSSDVDLKNNDLMSKRIREEIKKRKQ